MASLSYDGQSLILDNRRLWLASGAIHYPRVPREQWPDRILAAKQAGLNCVETYCFWNLHEPRPGVFDFKDQLDLRAFVKIIDKLGLYCILRPGPYVCAEWDFGGLPAWLHKIEGLRLRGDHPAFLEACARYYGAIMGQVRDLQVSTSAGAAAVTGQRGGPILMIQAENEWFCSNPQVARTYLGELVRYLRENGCTVPINDCNNLFARVEGTISCWNGRGGLPANLRQLHVVQPDAPRLVTEYWPGWFDAWGSPHDRGVDEQQMYVHLGQILASGAQYNLYMFHGGTNFGFTGGRTVGGPFCHMTTSYDYDAPLAEGGARTAKYALVKRVSTFATQFGEVLANLDPKSAHCVLEPGHDQLPSVVHLRGLRGEAVFLFAPQSSDALELPLLLPNGLKISVPMGQDRLAWTLLNVELDARTRLDFTNLRPWAWIDRRMLVLFGPAGAQGVLGLSDATLRFTVPQGQTPLTLTHEKTAIVVLNEQQVDAAYLTPQGVVVGCDGLDEHQTPLPRRGWATCVTLTTHAPAASASLTPTPTPAAPKLTRWQCSTLSSLVAGSDPSFTPIKGPASLEELGVPLGYGWYRLSFKTPVDGAVLAPESEDRLHFYVDGNAVALLGHGPDATLEPRRMRLAGDVVVLADNLGRMNSGWRLGEKKGLFGQVYAVQPLKLAPPRVGSGLAPDLLTLHDYLTNVRRNDRPQGSTLTWKVRSNGKLPLVLDLLDLPGRCGVLVNGRLVAAYDQDLSGRFLRLTLHQAVSEIRLGFFGAVESPRQAAACVRLYRATENLTAQARWAFAPWQPPTTDQFTALKRVTGPTWFRAEFVAPPGDVPLWLEPLGLTKGQVFLNGRNLGRYFVATASGKRVPPQQRYYLPPCWLHAQKPNELMLFEEHGRSPLRCRLVYDRRGPYEE